MVAEQYWANPDQIMATYEPEVFANVAVDSRANDWRRTERVQKGEGARLYRTLDDLAVPGRQVCSIDSLEEFVVDAATVSADIAQSTVDALQVQEALDLLDEHQRQLIVLVNFAGYTVVEAAPMVGLSRSYAQRRLGAARAAIIGYVIAA
jgi:DNA-directed RNA polymerase specialized sigma24 family protein